MNAYRRLRNSAVTACCKCKCSKRCLLCCALFMSSFSLTALLTSLWPHLHPQYDVISYSGQGHLRRHENSRLVKRPMVFSPPKVTSASSSSRELTGKNVADGNVQAAISSEEIFEIKHKLKSKMMIKNLLRNLKDLTPKPSCNEISKNMAKSSSLPAQYRARGAVLAEYCARMGVRAGEFGQHLKRQSTENIYVNDDLGFIFCRLPKVAVTNWKRVLLYLLLNKTSSSPLDSHLLRVKDSTLHKGPFRKLLESTRLSVYNYSEVLCRLRHYRKIIFVRHPLDRLLSAYRSKFVTRSIENLRNFFIPYGRDIIRHYRSSPSNLSLTWGADVTFDEFLQSVLETPAADLNRHWAPYAEQCFPCNIGYDFIGTYETMDDDAKYLLDSWGVGENLRFPRGNRALSEEGCRYHSAYSEVPLRVVNGLTRKFSADFEMFGYDSQPRFDVETRDGKQANAGNLMNHRKEKVNIKDADEKEERTEEERTDCQAWLQADEQARQQEKVTWSFLDSDPADEDAATTANRMSVLVESIPELKLSHFE